MNPSAFGSNSGQGTRPWPPGRQPSGLGGYFKTALLLSALTALVLALGQSLGGRNGLLMAGLFVAVMNFGSYWFSDRIALAMHGARPLSRAEVPWLFEIVERLTRRAEIPMPRLYLIPIDTPNAFATGRNPSHAAVAVTEGILQLLDRRELEGVLAHELAHVSNRDTLISTVAATIAGVISHLAQMAFYFGGSILGRGSDEDEGGSPFASLGLLLVAPVVAMLLQLAVSRTREYEADATGARLMGDPEALARALGKLQLGAERMPYDRAPGTAHLFIVNPLSSGALMHLFSTHPPLEERIRRLRGIRL